ncbi:MAG: 1-phosphofructokinase family hexose kinase [Chitinophagales bacterium]
MASILTLTFSPCIDKTTTVTELIPEKKLKCAGPILDPGGGGINVARAIRKLGGNAIAVYPAGGYTGKAFKRLLKAEKVNSIVIESKNETRENIIVFEEKSGKQFRFGMPGTKLLKKEWQKCLLMIKQKKNIQFIVASGSLPPGVPANIYAQLAVIAKKKNAKLVVDTSGEALKHAAHEGVYLLKPNLAELSFLVGKKHLNERDIAAAANKIISREHCEVLVISMGNKGAMLFTKDIFAKVIPPPVKIKSTVGAGDSMVAGIVYALSKGKDLKTSLQYGVASGTAATLHPGTELCSKEATDKLFKKIQRAKSGSR